MIRWRIEDAGDRHPNSWKCGISDLGGKWWAGPDPDLALYSCPKWSAEQTHLGQFATSSAGQGSLDRVLDHREMTSGGGVVLGGGSGASSQRSIAPMKARSRWGSMVRRSGFPIVGGSCHRKGSLAGCQIQSCRARARSRRFQTSTVGALVMGDDFGGRGWVSWRMVLQVTNALFGAAGALAFFEHIRFRNRGCRPTNSGFVMRQPSSQPRLAKSALAAGGPTPAHCRSSARW